MQTRERAHCARSVFPFTKKKKEKKKFSKMQKLDSKHVQTYNLYVCYISCPNLNPQRVGVGGHIA